jgi:hypothetical protein
MPSSAVIADRRVAAIACAGTAVLPLLHWLVADVSYDATSQQHEWLFVLFFSAVILVFAPGFLAVAGRVSSRGARRAADLVAVVSVAASLTNIVEDGLGVEAAFLAFVAELLLFHLSCLGMGFLILLRESGLDRLWAAVPVGTVAGIVLYVELGGPLLAVTWLSAAMGCVLSRPVLDPVHPAQS